MIMREFLFQFVWSHKFGDAGSCSGNLRTCLCLGHERLRSVATRRTPTLSSNFNLPHAINFKAVCGVSFPRPPIDL
jgi:hypothetical protein